MSLQNLHERYTELERAFENPEILKSPEKLRKISQEYHEIKRKLKILEETKKRNIIVEIRAGVGGDEAELFTADLFGMYSKYAEAKGLKTYLISSNRTGLGGLKEVIFEVKNGDPYSHFKYEKGVHRVQRIPQTEKSGRIHTSTVTVAVMPEAKEREIEIKPKDLKIETFRSGGKGGQNVNKVATAVRITHLVTGLVVSCQDERSQAQNKNKALVVLRSRLLAQEEEKKQTLERAERKGQIGGAFRAEKIRTYNFPQDRVTDHRLKKNFYGVERILNGQLDEIIKTLKKSYS